MGIAGVWRGFGGFFWRLLFRHSEAQHRFRSEPAGWHRAAICTVLEIIAVFVGIVSYLMVLIILIHVDRIDIIEDNCPLVFAIWRVKVRRV